MGRMEARDPRPDPVGRSLVVEPRAASALSVRFGVTGGAP